LLTDPNTSSPANAEAANLYDSKKSNLNQLDRGQRRILEKSAGMRDFQLERPSANIYFDEIPRTSLIIINFIILWIIKRKEVSYRL